MRGLSGWGFAAALSLLPFLALADAAPVLAQFAGYRSYGPIAPPPEMMPGSVAQRLSRAGYKVRWIKRRDGVFLADASDRDGRSLRLVLDVADGRILQRFVMLGPNGRAAEMDRPAPRPRPQAPGGEPVPSEATVAHAPIVPAPVPEEVQPPVDASPQAPLPATAEAGSASTESAAEPEQAVSPEPGNAEAVPVNPLD